MSFIQKKVGRQELITIDNEKGLIITLSNYGATLMDIKTTDLNGNIESVVLRHRKINDYIRDYGMMGKTVGRVAGRIKGGSFAINNTTYQIGKKNKDLLHSGKGSLSFSFFDYEIIDNTNYTEVIYKTINTERKSHFPGDLYLFVHYKVSKNINDLVVTYEARANKDTLCNITNHTYFNLSGDVKSPMNNELIKFNAKKYFVNDEKGLIKNLDNVKYDFTSGITMNKLNEGLDNFFLLDDGKVIVYDDNTKRELTITSDSNGVQIFAPLMKNKDAWCIAIEMQNMPDGINRPEFNDQSILRANNDYYHEIKMEFRVK